MRIRTAVVAALLLALCFALQAPAGDVLPLFLKRHRPAPPDAAAWANLRALLPPGIGPPTRDPLSHAFTFNTSLKLALVPGFSQVKAGTQSLTLSKPVQHYDGDLFIAREDVPRIKSLLSGSGWRDAGDPAGQKLRRHLLVVLDPGHGGHDPGAVQNGVREKDVNIRIARRLKPMLESKGFEVKLTRSGDTFVALEERAAIANRLQADLFVSIHANSEPTGTVAGIETYYCDNSSRYSPIARGIMAAQTYKLDALKLGLTHRPTSDVCKIIYGLLIEDARYRSRELASVVQTELVEHAGAASRGTKLGPFRVLRLANCPAILIETGFLSHRHEARRLTDPAYHKRIAEGIARGLVRYAVASGGQPDSR